MPDRYGGPTQKQLIEAAKTLDFENGSSIAYNSEESITDGYESITDEYKPPVHERRIPGEEPDYRLLQTLLRYQNYTVPLKIGGRVEIQRRMPYKLFLRL